jgi:hypothetical protein
MARFITTSITWGDDDFETDAATASEAAIKHAVEGWQNEEIERCDPDVDEVPIGKREPVKILVVDGRRDATAWMVEWREGRAIAREVQP